MAFANAKPPSLGTHNEDVDFQNQTLIREGWLLKDGGRIGSGKERFFVLKFGGDLFTLQYYANSSKTDLRGTLIINRYANFTEISDTENGFSVDVTYSASGTRKSGEKVIFRAPSVDSLERWENAFATASPCLDPIDTSKLSSQELEGHALKESAKRVLGYGYNRHTLSLQERSWEVNANDIDIFSEKHIQAQAYGNDELSTVNELNKRNGIKLAVSSHLPGVTASISGAVGSNNNNSIYTKSIVCTYVHIKEAYCKLNKLPIGGNKYKEIGDSFVKSVYITAGFEVRILVEETSLSKSDSTDLSGKIALGSVTMGGVEVFSERFEQSLKSTNNIKITMWAEGSGGFDASIKPFPVNIEEAMAELVSLDERFRRELPHLNRRQFTIQPTRDSSSAESDLGNYTELFINDNNSNNRGSMVENSKRLSYADQVRFSSHKPMLKYSSVDIDAIKSLEIELTKGQFVPNFPDIEGFKLYTFLSAIKSILLPTAIQVQKPICPALRTVYVIGMSGKGKSTLLGYLMGHTLKKANNTLVYADGINDPDRPYIGHLASETKGCTVYNTGKDQEFEYIDCAGTLDTAGPENDICNAIAMSMMSQKRPPVALLVVIDSHCFSDRAIVFFKLIERIIKAFKGHELAEVLPSIVFIINNKQGIAINETNQVTGEETVRWKRPDEVHKDIMDEIHKAIAIKKMERSKIYKAAGVVEIPKKLSVDATTDGIMRLGSSLLSATLSSPTHNIGNNYTSTTKRRDSKIPLQQSHNIPANNLHEADIRKLEVIQEELFVLKQLRNLPRNFIIATMCDNGSFRENVRTALKNPLCRLGKDVFNATCIYEETVSNLSDKIQAFTSGAARYFNTLFSELVELKEESNDHTSHKMNLTTYIDELNSGTSNVGDTLKSINSSIEITTDRINVKTSELEELQKKITSLSSDSSKAKIATVGPKSTIRMRSFYALIIATKYEFEYETPIISTTSTSTSGSSSSNRIPILDYEVFEGHGSFEFFHPDRIHKQGHILATYTPGYWKHENDCNSHIDVYVENRYIPSTIQAIKDITIDINERQLKLNKLKIQLQAYQDSAENTKRGVIMQRDTQIQSLNEELSIHINALDKSATSITTICTKLDSYENMCKVFSVIIKSLNYCSKANSSDKDTCQKMIDFVDNHTFNAPTCQKGGHSMWEVRIAHLHGIYLACSKCSKNILAKQLHWTCRACDEDYCSMCV